jgi:type IX secretion system PorP/SprF family membrane protein
MKNKITSIFYLAACLLLPGFVIGQDIHFSQFYMAPLTQNPALAGYNHDYQAILNYKSQWQSVPSPYKTSAGSLDMRVGKKKTKKSFWAAGVNFFSDKAGDSQMGTTQGNLSAVYHVRLSKYSTFGTGLQAGFVQRSISSAGLQWGNQYDGSNYNAALESGETSGSIMKTYADFGGGLLWNYNNTAGEKNVTDNHDLKINFGVSAFHLNQPKYSFYNTNEKLNIKYVAHGSALISKKNSNIAYAPGFMYYRQGAVQEIYVGSLIRYKLNQDSKYTGLHKGAAISFGGFVRAKDAAVACMLFEYSSYAIGFSYDINTSPLRTASNARGGFEISLRFVNPNPFLYKGRGRL